MLLVLGSDRQPTHGERALSEMRCLADPRGKSEGVRGISERSPGTFNLKVQATARRWTLIDSFAMRVLFFLVPYMHRLARSLRAVHSSLSTSEHSSATRFLLWTSIARKDSRDLHRRPRTVGRTKIWYALGSEGLPRYESRSKGKREG